jgi:hypothetical protein
MHTLSIRIGIGECRIGFLCSLRSWHILCIFSDVVPQLPKRHILLCRTSTMPSVPNWNVHGQYGQHKLSRLLGMSCWNVWAQVAS